MWLNMLAFTVYLHMDMSPIHPSHPSIHPHLNTYFCMQASICDPTVTKKSQYNILCMKIGVFTNVMVMIQEVAWKIWLDKYCKSFHTDHLSKCKWYI